MDLSDATDLVKNVGFPILAFWWLAWRVERKLDALLDAIKATAGRKTETEERP
jgi:hypothetical protein